MYADEVGEYRLLASIVDRPQTALSFTPELFTGDRRRVYEAMQRSYLADGELTTEGVEFFFGRMLPPEIEAARGAKANPALVDKLVAIASKRQVVDLVNKLSVAISSDQLKREDIARMLLLKPLVTSQDGSLSTGITSFVSDLHRKITKQYTFVSTGLEFLDTMLGGEWPRKAITVLMAQGGGGKTALVVNSILAMARMQIPSLFISLEMPRDRIIARMVANIANVDGLRIRRGDVTEEEQDRINNALEELSTLEPYIFIVDEPGMNITEIVHHIQFYHDAHNIKAFFLDYLQIIGRDDTDNTAEAYGYLTQQLRNIAVRLDLSAVALSQQNRGFQGLASLLGSGRIGHISDVVFEIKFDVNSTNDVSRMCTLDFHKNRDGPVGAITCIYFPSVLRFQ